MGNLPLFIQFYILTWSSLNWGICYNRRQCIFKMWFVVGKLKSSYVMLLQNRADGSVHYGVSVNAHCSLLRCLLLVTVFAPHALTA